MSEENYIPLRKFINESLLRKIILFSLLFLLILTQEWSNILLVLFPFISFGFSLFFEMIGVNKWRIQSDDSPITFNPLGSEKKHSSRLYFTSILQLIILFWLGAESLYRPQMINLYSLLFNPIFLFIYFFGYYWIFIDLWKYSKISVLIDQKDKDGMMGDYKFIKKQYNEVFSDLKINTFKRISIGSLIVFLLLNLINLVFILMQLIDVNLGIPYILPGTGIELSEPIIIPYFIFIVLVLSPLSAIFFLLLSYKNINNLSLENIQKLISPLPENIQLVIKKNLKLLCSKIEKQVNFD